MTWPWVSRRAFEVMQQALEHERRTVAFLQKMLEERPVVSVPDARVIPPVPDSEFKVLSAISRETLSRATEGILEVARERGISMTEEEARSHAALMLNGEMPL